MPSLRSGFGEYFVIFQQHTVAPGGAVYAINAAAIFRYKISGAGAASGSGEFPKAAQRAGGDRNLCGSAGGGQECAGEDHPAQPAAGGPCGKEILRPAWRPGGPDLNWNHWADEGRGYL